MSVTHHEKIWEAYFSQEVDPYVQRTRQRINWLLKHLFGKDVLDVGCSSGVLPILAAREGCRVVGVDNDRMVIDEARTHLKEETSEVQARITFICQDFLSYDEREEFDTVVLAEILEHFARPEEMVRKAKACLRKDGRLLVAVPFGINEYGEHKNTWYMEGIYNILSKYISIEDWEIIDEWIYFVCNKNNITEIKLSYTPQEIKKLEKAFYLKNLYLVSSLNNVINKKIKLENDNKDNLKRINKDMEVMRSKHEEALSREIIINKNMISLEKNHEHLQNQYDMLVEDRQKLEQQLKKVTINYRGMAAREKRYLRQIEVEKKKNKKLQDAYNKMEANFLGMKGREQHWLQEQKQWQNKLAGAQSTISYRLGASILNAGKSWRGFFGLPAEIMRIGAEARRRRRRRRERPNIPMQLPQAEEKYRFIPCFQLKADKTARSLRVAAIMDEFTFANFAPECEIIQLMPDTWQNQMEEFHPSLLFIESAWQGKDSAWKLKISGFDVVVQALVAYCRQHNIPSMLWNKEDPVHYSTFLPLAKVTDFVFTTDVDSIGRYKHDIGHERVYWLPFAAQPRMHNPLETYARQKKFCFAGSYYLRYPERQQDFVMLMSAVEKFGHVDIYDRNYDNPHPHYMFPEKYRHYILGKLPYSEIDKAYKGYDFGISMNTIKQSQTMFARRAFELAACNTVVVSNFSRGLRNLFGDLVISGADESEIVRRLRPLWEKESVFRKHRLLALRHVMSKHTCRKRLEYVQEKVFGLAQGQPPHVCLVARVADAAECRGLIAQFTRQEYPAISLCLIGEGCSNPAEEGVWGFADEFACRQFVEKIGAKLVGVWKSQHYYGPQYVTDLALAMEYCQADVFGKGTCYAWNGTELQLVDDGCQYRLVPSLPIHASVCRTASFGAAFWKAVHEDREILTGSCLATDEFHYARNGALLSSEQLAVTLDMNLTDRGVDFEGRLIPISETLPAAEPRPVYGDGLFTLSENDLAGMFKSTGAIRIVKEKGGLKLLSHLPEAQHAYLYGSTFARQDINLLSNSEINMKAQGSLNLRFVYVFLDAAKEKLSHAIVAPGKTLLAIPEACQFIRLGLRVEGKGEAVIQEICFGQRLAPPTLLLCRSSRLVLAKQYPFYNDLYKYGFLHSRIKSYREHSIITDQFRFRKENTFFTEFEGIDVATGDAELLDATLASGQISHVLVHMLDKNMWSILKRYLDKIHITIWIHGAEIQSWKRRKFEFRHMNAKEIEHRKKITESFAVMWRDIINIKSDHIHFILVSHTFKRECEEDIGISFPENFCEIIHNFVDGEKFNYYPKTIDQRFRILSIRPFSSLKYANDLTVAAISELASRPGFSRYQFTIVGDGPLFEETVRPIIDKSNIIWERRFLRHEEMKKKFLENGILLCPTRCDAQGVSRDEGMAAGLVPVTSAVMSIPEFVDSTCGFLAPPEDFIRLADAIERLAADPELFLTMSKNAAEHVRRLSGFEQTIAREMELILKYS